MQIIRGFHNIKNDYAQGCVVSIGNFDGYHLGHQEILEDVVWQAKSLNVPSVVIIFEPQPLEFLDPINKPARLTNFRNKIFYLEKAGINDIICINFDAKLSQIPANDFVINFLVKKLNIKSLVVGDDFRLGKNQQGNFDQLLQISKNYNFLVKQHKSFCLGSIRISSSVIRESLQLNNYELVEQMLGRPYSIIGKVISGNKLGRTIGFPTANIGLNKMKSPLQGVFSVLIELENQVYQGVANIGIRPTINGKAQVLEVHILNFQQDIYGKIINVIFKTKIRSEKKFNSFNELKHQIKLDKLQAEHYFNNSNERHI